MAVVLLTKYGSTLYRCGVQYCICSGAIYDGQNSWITVAIHFHFCSTSTSLSISGVLGSTNSLIVPAGQ